MKKFIFLYLVLLVSSVAFCDEEYTDLQKLRISASQADVIVTTTQSGNKVSIRVEKSRATSGCKYEVSNGSRELVINAMQTSSSSNCPYVFNITIPVSVHFDATITQGTIKMNGDFTDSIFDVETGTIEVAGKGGNLQIKGKKTSFDFKGSSPLMAVGIDEGAISIEYLTLPNSGELQLDSKIGDVVISIPRGIEVLGSYFPATYLTEYTTKSGFKAANRVYGGSIRIKRN